MSRFLIIVLSFLICVTSVNAQEQSLSVIARVSDVTVYPDAALITRSASVDLSSGMNQVSIDNIISEIDENSITVSGQGTAEVKLHGAFVKRNFLVETPDERINDLTKKIEGLNDQIVTETGKLQAIQSQRDFLKSLQMFSGQQIPKDLATKMPTTQELEGLLGFIGSQNGSLDSQTASVNQKIRELQKEKLALQNELNQLRNPSENAKRSIVVNVECLKKGNFTLKVSYLVRGVYWWPVYDARASFSEGQVELTSFGMIKQNTAEDWTDVTLSLSTAKPSISGQLPYVDSWVLRPYQQPVGRMKSARMATEQMAAAPVGGLQYEPYYLDSAYSVERGVSEQKAEIATSVIQSKGVSVSYQLPGKVTVKSDGTEHKLPIASQILKAVFSYSAYPRLSQYAYLGTRVVNDKDLQLLAGEVNIFLDGDYVGKSNIQNIGPAEEFDLFLGVDESVKVERKEIAKKIDDVLIGGIASPNKKTTLTYKITAENYKAKPINVIVYEATPVSENDRIKTKVMDVSPEPKEKDWNSRKGIWRWELAVEPKVKKEINYSFYIEHPREMIVDGM